VKPDNSLVPAWVQVATGACLGAIALAAVRVDVLNNYEYGLSEGGPELATVMVLAAVCVVALPVVAAIYGWSSLLRWMTALCVLMTVWCATNAYAQRMGHSILSKTSQASVYAGAEQDQAAARATLARISETADTAALEALIIAAKAKADAAEKADTRKMGSTSCFKACRTAQADHMALLARLSEAKARDAARLALAEAKTEAQVGPAEASMVATWIAARTDANATDIARTIALAMTILGIIVTQGAALLAHTAAVLIGSGLRPASREAPNPPKRAAGPTTVKSEAEALEWLHWRIRQEPGRKLVSSGRQLASELNMKPATFAAWLKRWSEQGQIAATRQGNGSCFALPRIRRVA
jgi:hypothetical protein